MSRPLPLFDEPAPAERKLSRRYAVLDYRLRYGEKARWSEIKAVNPGPCDECFAEQFEGRPGAIRANAKRRRVLVGGPDLRLCRQHAGLWEDRDHRDTRNRRTPVRQSNT